MYFLYRTTLSTKWPINLNTIRTTQIIQTVRPKSAPHSTRLNYTIARRRRSRISALDFGRVRETHPTRRALD